MKQKHAVALMASLFALAVLGATDSMEWATVSLVGVLILDLVTSG